MRGQTLSSVPSISKDVLVLVHKKIPCGHALTGQGRNEPISRIKLNPDQHYKRWMGSAAAQYGNNDCRVLRFWISELMVEILVGNFPFFW